ncbi:ATP-grasp domain-containing protein [Bacillus toyonensis]|uniref:ATP-grasp domain-containing protein n=1 Tax=Bacillus toyonensis TaxID=155322 RepID=UPI003D22A584
MKLLILIATKRNKQLFDMAYQYALGKGYEVFAVNTYKENKDDLSGDRSNPEIFSDPRPFIAIAQILNVDAVVCLSSEKTLERDALIKKELENTGVIVIAQSLETIETLLYKEQAKRYFQNNKIPTSPGGIVKAQHELKELVDLLGFPLVTKRSRGAGGMGNNILENYDDLNIFINGRKYFGEEILVEKFINGIELAIEIVGHNGHYICTPLIYQGKTKITGGHPIKNLSYVPYGEAGVRESVENIALKIANELNLCGCAELEIIWEPYSNSIHVLEVNLRTGGNTLLGMAYTNINIPAMLIDMADNTWNNNLDVVTTDKLSVQLDLIPGLSKSVIDKVFSLPTFFKCSKQNKNGQCVKFILSGKKSDIMADIDKIKLLEVSLRLKNSSDLYRL